MLTPIKLKLAQASSEFLQKNEAEIFRLFEIPKSLEHGHISLPVFQCAKTLKKKPPQIASELAELLLKQGFDEVLKIETIQGFVNIHLKPERLLDIILSSVRSQGEKLGYSSVGSGQKISIEFPSANVAKPMHIGHLRTCVIGQALYNLALTQGYDVTSIDHLGDWGAQFGKLCFAYEKWGEQFDFKTDAFEALYKLYVHFHSEAEKNPDLEEQGKLYFKRLEDGDKYLEALWKKFVDITLENQRHITARLRLKTDKVMGESFYNDKLKPLEDELEQKGLLVESEGAMVVDLEDSKMPPCLIRKTDGASLYATRDLAAAMYRMKEMGFKKNIYVVGSEQTLHFRQLFKVLEKMGYEWHKDCHHVPFGIIRFKDIGKISSRKGNIIRLSDVLDKAYDLVHQRMSEKNPDLKNLDSVAESVATGAIIFNDLMNDRVKNVEFDWDRALSFEGDSGPYVQYVHVRCESILRKWGKEVSLDIHGELTTDSELELMGLLLQYGDILSAAYAKFKPNILANYLLDVCSAFNRFYNTCRIIGGDEDLQKPRLALVLATKTVIKSGLGVLNIQAPSEM